MTRIDTLRLVALLAPFALAGTACSGNADSPATSPETEQAAASDNPTAEFTAEDPANAPAPEGSEADDPGFAAAVAETEVDTTPDEPGADGIAQKSDALLSTRGTKLIEEARREAAFLNRSTSYYSHTTYMNESTGTRRTDCSGFLGYALNRVMPDAYAKVPHPNTYKPLANDWYNYLSTRYTTASTQTSPRWRRVVKATDLKPGDVIAWLTPSNVVSENTGHVMVVNGYPRAGRSAKNEIVVPIVDSTRSPHANDSRGSTGTGVGTGTLGIRVDSNDRPTGYYWRGGESSTAYSTKIAFGRVE